MDLFFSLHHILKIRLTDPPSGVKTLLKEMLGYFECGPFEQAGLNLVFVADVPLPERYVHLKHDLLYDNGCFYMITEGGIISFPINDLFSDDIQIRAQLSVSPVQILYLVEQVINARALDAGYSIFHAVSVREHGAINLYSGMRGAGKTILAFNKLRQGADFIGDDKIFVNRDGEFFAYPRGITVHRHLGNDYNELKRNSLLSKEIRKEMRYFNFLSILRVVAFPKKGLRIKIERMLKSPGNIRAAISKIFPKVKIINSGIINYIYLFLKAKPKQELYGFEQFGLKRAAKFILINNGMERDMASLQTFFACGDPYAADLEKKLKKLIYRERRIVMRVLKLILRNNVGRINVG